MNKFLIILIFAIPLWAQPEFQISGNFSYDDEEIAVQTGIGDEFNLVPENRKSFLLGMAEVNLKELYYSSGFFMAHFELSRSPSTNGEEKVNIVIHEGPKFVYGSIEVQQPTWSPLYKEVFEINSEPGLRYNRDELIQDAEIIKKNYRENGFLKVQLKQEVEIDTLKNRIDVYFKITPGYQARMGQLKINLIRSKSYASSGGELGKSDSSYVASLWSVNQGDVVPNSAISDFRKKLLFTNLFNLVKINDTTSTHPGHRDFTVTVQEKVPGTIGASAFYEDLIGFGLGASLRYRNMAGHFHQTSVEGVLAEHRQRIGLGYSHPLFFGLNVKVEDRIIYNQEQLALPQNPDSLENTKEVINLGQLSFDVFENLHFTGLTDLRYVNGVNRKIRFKFEPSLFFEWVDDVLNPRSGLKARYVLGQGGPFEWADRYLYQKAETKFYIPVNNVTVWAIAADYGKYFREAFVEDARLFYLGGFRSVRGYAPRSLFPSKTEDGLILTGLTPEFWRFSNEFRMDLPENWIQGFQWVQFLDLGWIWDQDKSFSESRRAALGMGIRYRLSLLTLRLDYTFKKEFANVFAPEPFEWGRFSLDLSQAF